MDIYDYLECFFLRKECDDLERDGLHLPFTTCPVFS